MDEMESKPKIVSWSSDGSVSIVGIVGKDQEKVTASFKVGAYWLRVKDSKLEIKPSWEPLPDPIRDPKMFPFWREPAEGEVKTQIKLFEIGKQKLDQYSSPSISIQHLCGYNYSEESYKSFAEQLESWGFECMRSRRGLDGKFWEIWFLCGLWAAKGALKEEIGDYREKVALKKATNFLAKQISFGTLDISVQRMAMIFD
jgi:hypothetical protein